MNHNIFPVFSTPIFVTKLVFEGTTLGDTIDELNKEEQIKINLEKNVGFTSKNKYILDNLKYSSLKKSIMDVLSFYNKTHLKYKTNFKMTTSWISKTTPNTSSSLHTHANSFLSGVLYLNVPENSGDIMFENMNSHNIQIETEEDTLYNANKFYFKPESGIIIFFPSNLHHKVLTNNSNLERLSVAFNFMPIGKVGSEDSTFEY